MRLMERQRIVRDKLTRATGIIVCGLRHGGDGDDVIREKVKAAFREALTGDEVWCQEITNPDDGQPDIALSTAGIYRMVFEKEGIDRADQMGQESLVGVLDQATEYCLANRDKYPERLV